MRVLFVNQHSYPEMGGGVRRDFEYARKLCRLGHNVTYLTTVPNYPIGKPYPGYRRKLLQRETIEDVLFLRVWTHLAPNYGLLRRLLSYGSFVFSGSMLAIIVDRPDVVVSTVMPIGSDLVGWVLSRLRGVAFVYQMQDLMPEAALRSELISSGVARLARKGFDFLIRKANKVIVVRDEIRSALISRGLNPTKIHVIPDGVDIDYFRPGKPDSELVAKYDLEGKFIVLYQGALSAPQRLETVLEAAILLRENNRIEFVLGGEGFRRHSLEDMAAQRQLSNVRIIGLQPPALVPRWIRTANLCLVHVGRLGMPEGTIIPSKTFEYMAVGRPVVFAVEGSKAREFIVNSGGGVWIDPENPPLLARIVSELSIAPERVVALGEHARSYVTRHHSRADLVRQLEHILIEACRDNK